MELYSLVLAFWILFILALSLSLLVVVKKTQEGFVAENLYQRNYVKKATDALTASDLIAKRFDVAITFSNNETVAFRKGANVQGSLLGFPRGGQGGAPVPNYAVFTKNFAHKVTFQNVVGNVSSISVTKTGPIVGGPLMNYGDLVIVDTFVPRWTDPLRVTPIMYTYYGVRYGTQYSYPQRAEFGALQSIDRKPYPNQTWYIHFDHHATVSIYFFVHTKPPGMIKFNVWTDDSSKAMLMKYPARDMDASVSSAWPMISAVQAKPSNSETVRFNLEEGFAYQLILQLTDNANQGASTFRTPWWTTLTPYVYWQKLNEDLNPAVSIVDPNKIHVTQFDFIYAFADVLPAVV